MRDERTTKDVCGEAICTRNLRSSKITVTKEKEGRKRKSEDKERRRRKKKAMVALLVVIIAGFQCHAIQNRSK